MMTDNETQLGFFELESGFTVERCQNLFVFFTPYALRSSPYALVAKLKFEK